LKSAHASPQLSPIWAAHPAPPPPGCVEVAPTASISQPVGGDVQGMADVATASASLVGNTVSTAVLGPPVGGDVQGMADVPTASASLVTTNNFS